LVLFEYFGDIWCNLYHTSVSTVAFARFLVSSVVLGDGALEDIDS